MKKHRSLLGSMLLTTALCLPAASSFAAPTVNTVAGDTRVALSADFTGALQTLGVAVAPSFPARISSGNAIFPIPTGEVDLETAKGEVVHNGGLNLSAGGLTVNLSSFVIDTSGDKPVLTGLVKANDSLVARIVLFDLALGSAPQVEQNRLYGNLRIGDVAVTLSAEAAGALNDAFGVTAFAAGLPIGTARVNTYFYEPDRKH